MRSSWGESPARRREPGLLGRPGSQSHPEAWPAGNIHRKELTKGTGRPSTSRQLSLGSEEGRSQSLRACLGTNLPLPLCCHFPLQGQGGDRSELLIQKCLLCKVLFLRGSKMEALFLL